MPAEQEWKARAEHAEERVRRLAALFRIPDGARYLNDAREVAEHQALEAELLAAQEREQELLKREREALKRAVSSEEREKALRDWVEGVRDDKNLPELLRREASAILWNTNLEALAGSPSEKSSKDAEGAKP